LAEVAVGKAGKEWLGWRCGKEPKVERLGTGVESGWREVDWCGSALRDATRWRG
jgi:hypothetical protein